jgi:NTP pyrophosphatase (non-canonical NTP hydrolase)
MPDTMETPSFHALQAENLAWAARNFPGQTSGQMLHGIVEELGELMVATTAEAVLDAAADILIYASSYCNHKRISLEEIWRRRILDGEYSGDAKPILVHLGKLSHAHLKAEQKIRGNEEKHARAAQFHLGQVLAMVEYIVEASIGPTDIKRVACDVWRVEVQPRDWTKQNGMAQP